MDDIRRNIRRIFWLYFLLFSLLITYLGKFIFVDSKEVINNSYNTRMKLFDSSVAQGSILDANGIVLAESVATDEGYTRSYPYGQTFAHVVGWQAQGGGGLESRYNFELQSLPFEIWQRLRNIIWLKPLKGQDIALTLNAELQVYVAEKLGNQKGAIVVIEPSTGKILAMASYPAFDPNTVEESWDDLLVDDENSPLINRATQGLYPPGSVFKVVTSFAALPDMQTVFPGQYECTGKFLYEGNQIRCFDGNAHGTVDMEKAFAVSCNSYFSQLGLKIGGGQLRAAADRLLWNTNFPLELQYRTASFPLNEASTSEEIMETAIGQGKTLTTPLHVAMFTSAIANGGILMQPYFVDTIGEGIGGKTMPRQLERIMSSEEALFLTDMMIGTVASGTALKSGIPGVQVAGKTGTAETDSGDDHGWFTAFAPAQKPELAVTILLENAGGSSKALPVARDIIQFYLR